MSKIRLEVWPWLAGALGKKGSRITVLEQEAEDGATAGDLLKSVAARYPALGQALFESKTGQLRGYVAIMINNQLAQSLQEASLEDGDTVTLLPFIDGG